MHYACEYSGGSAERVAELEIQFFGARWCVDARDKNISSFFSKFYLTYILFESWKAKRNITSAYLILIVLSLGDGAY